MFMFTKARALIMLASAGLLVSSGAMADLSQAQRLYENGRSDDALREVDGLLTTNPGDPEARFLQGIILAEKGRNEAAIEVFAGLTQDYPELPEPYNNLAVLFAENGDFEKAKDALLAAIQTHPSYSTAHENLGDLYAKMASQAYDRALTEDNSNNSARVKLSAVNGLFSIPRVGAPTSPPAYASNTTAATPAALPVRTEPAVVEPEPVVVEPKPEPPVVAVATPEPEPVREPAPQPAAPVVDETEFVVDAVLRWADAWAAQDTQGYLASYADSFAPPNGASRNAWENYRRERLTAPTTIEVGLEDIAVEILGGDMARAVFVQRYRSDNYRDVVRKTLMMTRSAGDWRIHSESSEPL